MSKRASLGLKIAIVLMFLTAAIHATALFVTPVAKNETERRLFELMTTYKQDLGGGFSRSTGELVTALSSCFSFLCLLGGLTLTVLLRRRAPPDLLRAVVGVHAVVFAACFAVMAVFTFLPPIVLTGLIFASLALTWLSLPRPL